jgi:hypothetical protein
MELGRLRRKAAKLFRSNRSRSLAVTSQVWFGPVDRLVSWMNWKLSKGRFASLAAALEGDGEGKIDARSMGGIAGGLVKLLEYRRKVQPQTAAEVVELAIGLGISPNEFIDQLEVAWQRRA